MSKKNQYLRTCQKTKLNIRVSVLKNSIDIFSEISKMVTFPAYPVKNLYRPTGWCCLANINKNRTYRTKITFGNTSLDCCGRFSKPTSSVIKLPGNYHLIKSHINSIKFKTKYNRTETTDERFEILLIWLETRRKYW